MYFYHIVILACFLHVIDRILFLSSVIKSQQGHWVNINYDQRKIV